MAAYVGELPGLGRARAGAEEYGPGGERQQCREACPAQAGEAGYCAGYEA